MAFLRSMIRYNLMSRKFSTQQNYLNLNKSVVYSYNINYNKNNLKANNNLIIIKRCRSSTSVVKPTSGDVTTAIDHKKKIAQAASSSSSSSSSHNTSPQRDPLDVTFDNPIAAFKSKTTYELIRAYIVYLLCSSEYLVDNNDKVK